MKEKKLFITNILKSKKLYFIIPVIAFLLALPGIGSGFMMDDYYHRLVYLGDSELHKETAFSGKPLSPFDAFTFMDGVEEHNRRAKAVGLMPWWSSDNLKVAFFRPIASLSHLIDYTLWPDSAGMMHIHSVLIFCLLAALLLLFYRALEFPGWSAGLAALFLVINSSWAMPVNWIANRNALLSLVFALPALMLYHRYMQSGKIKWQLGAMLSFILALLSGEAGLAIGAYIFSYTLFMDSRAGNNILAKLKAIAPYIVIVLVWRLVYNLNGYGVRGGSLYIDPVNSPLTFLLVMIKRYFLLLTGVIGGAPIDIYFIFSSQLNTVAALIGAVLLVLLSLLFRPLWHKNRKALFWAVGMLLSIIPFCSTFPSTRNLIYPFIGGMGLFSTFLHSYLVEGRGKSYKGLLKGALVGFFALFVLVNGLISPVSFLTAPANLQKMDEVNRGVFEIDGVADFDGKELILVNFPMHIMLSNGFRRHLDGLAMPAVIRVLSIGDEPVEGRWVDEQRLAIEPRSGFYPPPSALNKGDSQVSINYSFRRFELLTCLEKRKAAIGERFYAGRLEIEVEELTPDSRPGRVVYHFPKELSSEDYVWVTWDYEQGKMVPFTLPEQGESFKIN